MSTSTGWKWSADPVAEHAAVKAWDDAIKEGTAEGECAAVARAAVVKYINDRADHMGRPEPSPPPVVLIRGRFTMRDIKAKLRAYEALYGVKVNVAVAGRWVDKGDPIVLNYEWPRKVTIKGETFEVVLGPEDTCYVRPEVIDFAVFRLTPVMPANEATKEKA